MSCCLFVDFSVQSNVGNGLPSPEWCPNDPFLWMLLSNSRLDIQRRSRTVQSKNLVFSSLITERNVFYKLYCQIIKDSKFKPCLLQGFVISRDIPGFRESRILFLWSGFAAGIRSLTASFKLYSVATIYTIQNRAVYRKWRSLNWHKTQNGAVLMSC